VKTLVVDASVAIKWIVTEEDSERALALKARYRIVAPQLIYAECSNILWKKARRGEISPALIGDYARMIAELNIDTTSLRALVEPAAKLSQASDHPTYDCFYLALALNENCLMVTADQAFYRKLWQLARPEREACVLLQDVVVAD
jgi:predicted nucleic acid-binding protein